MTQNRKRGRSLTEDEVEFMPLSKRINNLHINNILLENSNECWGPGPPQQQQQQQPLNYYQNQLPESPQSSSEPNSVEWNLIPQYTPDLSETQNPHYFNINKLLFEMYVQRLQRGYHQN